MHAYIDLLKGTKKTQGTKENSPLEKGSAYTAAATCVLPPDAGACH